MKRVKLIFILGSAFLFLTTFSIFASSDKIPITTSSEEAKKEFEKGRDLFEKLQVRESLTHFENAFKKDNSFASAYFYHAQANPNATGFFEDLANAVKYSMKASEGERLLIMSLQNQSNGNTKLQEENLLKAVELYPNDERAHNFAGAYYFGQQKYDKAIEHFEKSIKINPEYSSSYNLLGYAYKNVEKYAEAGKIFKKIHRANSG